MNVTVYMFYSNIIHNQNNLCDNMTCTRHVLCVYYNYYKKMRQNNINVIIIIDVYCDYFQYKYLFDLK